MSKQIDMDLDGSRYDLLLLVYGLFSTIQMMECRMTTILEALSRSGVTITKHADYGWQWTLDSGVWGRTDTLADAVEAGIYNLIAHDT